jgi:hypothetical protein
MELWTEYEGRTIDGAFPLAKLLQPEGRSAFFSTPNGSGTPTVIRLIESHFDDDDILARWRGVAALNHPNLVKLKNFGKVEMDGAPLVYAVMEPADGNLGEIIAERRLTLDETREVAASLTAALGALHDHGFVHEHVQPGSVLAVGDAIKLRSDCIRESPEGEEGAALKRRDVHDLALVLLRALTQRRTQEDASREMPLAAPFDEIVRNGMDGSWGLAEIASALVPSASPRAATSAAAVRRVAAPVERGDDLDVAAMSSVRTQRRREDADDLPRGMWLRVVLALSVLVLGVIAWRMFHSRPAEQRAAVAPSVASQVAPVAAPVSVPVASENTGAAKVSASAASAVPSTTMPPVAGPHVEWRVIAFTYNHEDQAKTKAERVAGRHPELQPEVFTPNGRAPYLVSIGGAMGRADAYALARQARARGIAGDVYAQNFRVTAH